MSVFTAFATLLPLLAQAASPAAAPGGAAQPMPGGLFSNPLVPMVLIGVMMYFVLIRPQQRRQKEQQNLISSAKSGDEVVTSGGLHGIITNARGPESKTVLVKFAENVKIEVDKSAIASVSKAAESAAKTS